MALTHRRSDVVTLNQAFRQARRETGLLAPENGEVAVETSRDHARRRRPHGPSGPGGSLAAGPDGRSMSVPAWMSLPFGASPLLAKRQCSPERAPGVTQQAGLHLG